MRVVRLAAIATAAGAFSGLFGVGGGTIIVPLLVLWLGYEQKEATGTSLAAIILIGALAAGFHALYGNVDLGEGHPDRDPRHRGRPGRHGAAAADLRACGGGRLRGAPGRLGRGARLLMDALDWSGLIALGFAAGMAGGLVGVGGGVLFVPALVVFAHESQLGAEATSLVAIVLVSVVGTARQRSYGNLRLKDGLLIGVLSPVGVLVGVVLANLLSARVLELAFAAMQLAFAWQLAKKAGLR